MNLKFKFLNFRRFYLSLIICPATLIFVFYQRLISGPDYRIYYSFLANFTNEDDCQLPKNNPYDESILKYLFPASPLVCKKLQPELTKLVNSTLVLDLDQLSESGYSLELIDCQFRCFSRKNGDDVSLNFDPWQKLVNGTFVACEFVEIACWKNFPPLKVYANLHAQIVLKEDLLQKQKKKMPSVLLFVLDSVSQNNWKRNLPKTLNVLKNNFSSIVFEGFTKVGDNSFPNAAAFLAGVRAMTVGFEDEAKAEDGFFDDWPIIWKDFERHNYATFYAEDYPEFNLFKYLANGFRNQPTHHYFRPFWLQLYGSFLHRRSTHLCFGNNPCHRLQLDYLEQFIRKYSENNVPIFALNWLTELGHDWLNQVAIGDDDLAEFFQRIRTNFKDSFVFVFADHGHRFDPIRQSVVGRIEERMPFFSISLPEFVKKRVPELEKVVERNAKQLASFWDLHATLKEIVDLAASDDWEKLSSSKDILRQKRGLSLLRSLPEKRNCETAGIPEDFCVCQKETQMPINDSRVQKSAKIIVEKINELLAKEIQEGKCAVLKLKEIQHAESFLPNMKIAAESSGFFVMFRVAIVADPSNGFFEGTVKHTVHGDHFDISGDINRINKYGNQSFCVNSAILRKYCFCV